MSRMSTVLAWAALVADETLCQVAAELSGRRTGAIDGVGAALAATGSGWVWIALGCYVAGFFLWMLILSRTKLSAAFPTSAIVFVSVMSASVVVLGERVGATQIAGCLAIVAGIVLLGADPSPSDERDAAPSILEPSPERSLP